MKKILTVLGGIFVVLVIVSIIGFLILNYFGNNLDTESMAYVDENIPKIISAWDSNELINQASPELLQVMSKEKIEYFFKFFSDRLGSLKEYKGSKGKANIFITTGEGKVITAAYLAEALFEKAPSTIQIRIIKHDDKWQILEFRVNSDALIP
ncbi:hypothetical protein KFV02_06420 [Desulfohalobiaceae bacterium Ax17]|uniref:hypothetical protein n=1 Tax=Desulfovulcanus ferrireducens TaxID=2831190 RepID=UPI00207B9872|nr:hypothetical protein [Desulfovulcanus ferrireducens]MBT8763565.1 hypothetical protein [Desulfovulcanus ferrireducens]